MAKEALELYGVQFFNNVEDGIRHEDGDATSTDRTSRFSD